MTKTFDFDPAKMIKNIVEDKLKPKTKVADLEKPSPAKEETIVFTRTVDQMLENLPMGSVERAIGNNLYGINYRQTGNPVPQNKDMYGFTFFTRPQLCLRDINITNYRAFYSLLTSNPTSYQRYTRMMLDPRLGAVYGYLSPLVDNENPFISTLTNNLISLSGWPDLTAPTYTSSTGLYGQESSFVDGVMNNYESFELDISFRNIKGNPLLYLFYIWIKYETLVFEGILNPYLDMITENEIDYNTRIYRLVMDQQKRFVTHIGCTGASFPISVPTGSLFDYNIDSPYNTQNNQINIRFKCLGFIAFEDIPKLWFNQTVGIFNPGMRRVLNYDRSKNVPDVLKMRDDPTVAYQIPGSTYIKIPFALASLSTNDISNNVFFNTNHKAIPYINLITNELEWWIDERNYPKPSKGQPTR